MSGTASVPTQFQAAVTATGLQLDNNFSTIVAYLNDPTNRANYAADGGSTNTLVINPSPPVVTGYSAGLTITFRAAFTNNGAVVANVSGIGNSSVLDQQGRQLTTSAIISGSVYQMAYNGTSAFNLLSPNSVLASQPSLTDITTAGAGTYTVSSGAVRLHVRGVGAGGGGGGPLSDGGAGGATRFGTLFADGGVGGFSQASNNGGAGGTATGAAVTIVGGAGSSGGGPGGPGGAGGNSYFGGGGGGARFTGATAAAIAVGFATGGGGGGSASTASGLGGGGAGGYFEHIFTSPATTYTYTVGTAGTGGNGSTVTTGSDGRIIIETHFS